MREGAGLEGESNHQKYKKKTVKRDKNMIQVTANVKN